MQCNSYPTFSNHVPTTDTINSMSEHGCYYYNPQRYVVIYHDLPMETMVDNQGCFKVTGNIIICMANEQIEIPYVNYGNLVPASPPYANVKPMISVTSVKMENHPEHISVMFSQALNNLK